MPVEIEAKMKVPDLGQVRAKLEQCDAVLQSKVLETNTFFDTEDRSLLAKDQGLRMRSARNLQTHADSATITFKGPRRGFAGARPNRDRLQGYFDVTYRVEDPRIQRVGPYQKNLFVHHFRVDSLEQMDDDFVRWIADAYDQVGCGNR